MSHLFVQVPVHLDSWQLYCVNTAGPTMTQFKRIESLSILLWAAFRSLRVKLFFFIKVMTAGLGCILLFMSWHCKLHVLYISCLLTYNSNLVGWYLYYVSYFDKTNRVEHRIPRSKHRFITQCLGYIILVSFYINLVFIDRIVVSKSFH